MNRKIKAVPGKGIVASESSEATDSVFKRDPSFIYNAGSAPGSNVRKGMLKFNTNTDYVLCEDDSGKAYIHLSTGNIILDTNTGKIHVSLNFDFKMQNNANESYHIYFRYVTADEFEDFFRKVNGKSLEEIDRVVGSIEENARF